MRNEVIDEVAAHIRLWFIALLMMVVDKSFFSGAHGFFDYLAVVYLYLLASVVIVITIRKVIK